MKSILRTCALLLPLGLMAACSPSTPPAKPPQAVNPGPPLTPNPMPPSYIGRWAASVEQCGQLSLTITDKGLTAGASGVEYSCSFSQVTPNETGWIAEGRCMATQDREAPPAAATTLVLNTTRAGAARTLALSGGPFTKPLVLLACEAAVEPPTSGAVGATDDTQGAAPAQSR